MTDTPGLAPIPGFPGYYAARDGRIFSTVSRDRPGRLREIKPQMNDTRSSGYWTIVLYKDGASHRRKLHRTILETFVGPCPPGMEGAHNDGNRHNNRADNLAWKTHQENIADRERHRAERKAARELQTCQ